MLSAIQRSHFCDLSLLQLYRLLQLRSEVFVVEQNCAYQDLDDRDHEPRTEHLWIEEDGKVLAMARVLKEEDGATSIGRVITAEPARGRGLAARIIDEAIDGVDADIVLNAQSYLVNWYAKWGFVVDGEEFLEDNIPHTPMRRPFLRSRI
jgi:ElaA protein